MRAMPRTRRTILRKMNKAGGAMTTAGDRHDRVLDHHHDGQADQRHQIAADGGDEKIDHLTDGGRAGGEPGNEFGRVSVGEEADVLLQELVEHAPLVVGDDAVADPGEHDGRNRRSHAAFTTKISIANRPMATISR